MLPVASSPSDVLTATSIAAFIKINDTGGGGGGMRLLFPESDEEDISDNGSASRKTNNALPIFDYSVSLFRSVGEKFMRWERSPPDRCDILDSKRPLPG